MLRHVELRDPPRPEIGPDGEWHDYRGDGHVPTHDYRVVFWWHQNPPPGSSTPPEDMAWGEVTIDVFDAEGVHEVIAWAEEYLAQLASDRGWEHTYCLLARVPKELLPANERDVPVFLHIAGRDPTSTDEFSRMHPFW
jgi:hypothetical protein